MAFEDANDKRSPDQFGEAATASIVGVGRGRGNQDGMERPEGIEPFVFGLEDRCSTIELRPRLAFERRHARCAVGHGRLGLRR